MQHKSVNYVFAFLRLGIGWIFLWAFLDKVFGLGFATKAGSGWLSGVSPTEGFLKFATKGPFAELYQSLAGVAVVDWLFMIGLVLIGLAFLLGMGMRIATYSGVLLYVFMYTAGFIPPEHNPFLDEHIMYPLLMIALNLVHAGRVWGLGAWWSKTQLVRKYPVFE